MGGRAEARSCELRIEGAGWFIRGGGALGIIAAAAGFGQSTGSIDCLGGVADTMFFHADFVALGFGGPDLFNGIRGLGSGSGSS